MGSHVRRLACVALFGALLAPTLVLAAPRHAKEASGPSAPLVAAGIAVVVLAVAFGFFALRGKAASSAGPSPIAGAPPTPPVPATPALPRTWKEKVTAVHPSDPFFFRMEAGRALLREMLSEAAKGVDGGQVKEVTDGIGSVELRGGIGGAPLRASIELAFGSVEVTLLRDDPLGALRLVRDMDKVPRRVDVNDPWDKEAPERVFADKGIYIPGPNDDPRDERPGPSMAARLATWAALPAETQATVLAEMARLGLYRLRGDKERLSTGPGGMVGGLEDPASTILATAKLLDLIRRTAATPSGFEAPAEGGATTLTCKYCRSLFVFGFGKTTCPNCGANATA